MLKNYERVWKNAGPVAKVSAAIYLGVTIAGASLELYWFYLFLSGGFIH